jgi:hypothetical protein
MNAVLRKRYEAPMLTIEAIEAHIVGKILHWF